MQSLLNVLHSHYSTSGSFQSPAELFDDLKWWSAFLNVYNGVSLIPEPVWIEDFYSTLNEEHISEKDYNHAKEVWNAFRIKNMGEYHDLYLQSNILLLTDVSENFRNTCMQYYGLDPCHYFTSPGLSWDAMLKMTKVNLELMTCTNSLKRECVVEFLT